MSALRDRRRGRKIPARVLIPEIEMRVIARRKTAARIKR